MKIIKKENEIILIDKEKTLTILLRGNDDLYWEFENKSNNSSPESNYFFITKENYELYNLFNKIYKDIKNANISKTHTSEGPEKYHKYNLSNYNELFNKEQKTITWYSDEDLHKIASILKIKKLENGFKLEFLSQNPIKDHKEDNHPPKEIQIRFRNSGSYYKPFNIVFMKMYNKLQEIEDVHDINHQYHIEEYLYIKEKNKVRKR